MNQSPISHKAPYQHCLQKHYKSNSRFGVKAVHCSFMKNTSEIFLTRWGWVMYIWVSKLHTIVSCNGLSPGWSQAIIWTNAGILLIEPIETKFSETLIEIHTFSFKNMHLKMSTKWRPFCFGLSVLICRLLSWERPWAHNEDRHTKIQLTMTRLGGVGWGEALDQILTRVCRWWTSKPTPLKRETEGPHKPHV